MFADEPRTFEIVSVDSGSTDATIEIRRHHPVGIEQIPLEAFDHARTVDLAAALAQAQFLVYLAADGFPAQVDRPRSLMSRFSDPSHPVQGGHTEMSA